ncbi:scavenger receptor cysteine-rich type 1 protein M130-like [Cetorhinus maximus]
MGAYASPPQDTSETKLGNYVQYRPPYLKKDGNALETVKRRFNRLMTEMGWLSSGERFDSVCLYPLEFRRARDDLIATLKILSGHHRVDLQNILQARKQVAGVTTGRRMELRWDLQDAAVVCRELGCGTAVSAPGGAHFGEGSGPIVTYDVECSGNEAALRDCKSVAWDHYSWLHNNDASAICSDHRFPRLVSGDSQCSGRLEIQFGKTWGTVCDLHWDWNDASVVCDQLQCGVAVSVAKGAYFGKGTGLQRSDKFECEGNETSLTDCPNSPVNENDCTHMNDVSVSCSGKHGPRLVGGENRCSGRVEVLHGGQWGTLCDFHFSLQHASVNCSSHTGQGKRPLMGFLDYSILEKPRYLQAFQQQKAELL